MNSGSPVPSRRQDSETIDHVDRGDARYLLNALDEHDRAMARGRGRIRHYRDQDYLIREGERTNGIFIIKQGSVDSLYETGAGRSLILASWQAGDFIGAPYVVGNHGHAWSARAVGAVEVLHLDQACLRDLIVESATFALTLIECLGYKGERYSKLAQVLATHKTGERLSLLLLELCRSIPRPEQGPYRVGLIKQERLAHMIGATRQSVSLALLKLEECGAISVGSSSFQVHDLAALARYAGLDSD